MKEKYKKHPAEDFYRTTRVERAAQLARMPPLISIPDICARKRSVSEKPAGKDPDGRK